MAPMSTQKTKCRHADAYKALRAPTCGCETCAFKWNLAQCQRAITKATDRAARDRKLGLL